MGSTITTETQMSNQLTVDPIKESFLRLPIGRLMVKNALPAVTSMLLMALYQAVDAILVGRRLGPEALASVNVLYPILAVFVGLAVMIGVGGNARIAILLGAGESKRATQILGLITILGAMLGVTGSLFVMLFFPQILIALGTSGLLGEFAGSYLKMMFPFFTPMIIFYILEQSMRIDGRAGMATLVMAGMACLNIVLDFVMLFILNMGIGGAALATGISQTLGATIFIVYFARKKFKSQAGLCFASPKGTFDEIGAVAINGFSELLNSLAVGLTTFLFNRLIISYVGSVGVAAFSVTQYLLTLGMMILIGLGNGAQPIISYNHGAGLVRRVQNTLVWLLISSLAIGMAFFIIMHFRATVLVKVFIPNHPEAIATSLLVTKTVSWSMLFIPAGIALSAFFTALEKARQSLIIAVCRGLLFTVTGLSVLPLFWGEAGIWITPVFAEGATSLVGILLLYQWLSENKPVNSYSFDTNLVVESPGL